MTQFEGKPCIGQELEMKFSLEHRNLGLGIRRQQQIALRSGALLMFVAIASPTFAQNTYNWTHNQNNNWDNGSNWNGASGYPDDPMDTIRFDSSNFGPNQTTIDLRGGTYDVATINMAQANRLLTFRSSNPNPGTIRVNDNVRYNNNAAGEGGGHTFECNVEVVGSSEWRGGEYHYVVIDGELLGSGHITTAMATAAIGELNMVLNNANPFSGHLTINDAFVRISNGDALQNAWVTINEDLGLQIEQSATSYDVNIGALSGTGDLQIRDHYFTTDSTIDTTFSGDILAYEDTGAFVKRGTGELTFQGDIDAIRSISNRDGTMTYDGGTVNVLIATNHGGSVKVVNGATVDLRGNGTMFNLSSGGTLISGAGSTVRNGGELATARDSGDGSIVVTDFAEVSDFTIISVGHQENGSFLATDNASVSARALRIGGSGPGELGGVAEFFATSNSTIDIDGQTVLWTSQSLLSVGSGATMSTKQLSSHISTNPTVQLGDPAGGGKALTVGTSDNTNPFTYSGLIEDVAGESGGIVKTGTNVMELTSNNTYSGGTVVEGGVLRLFGGLNNKAAGTGGVTVKTGATLAGSANVPGLTTIEAGGKLTPGQSIGQFVMSSVVFESGATLELELAGASWPNYDGLLVGGPVTLGGTLDLSYEGSFTAQPGDSFFAIQSAGTTGEFDNVIFPDEQTWYITYAGANVIFGVCEDDDNDGVCNDVDACPGGDDTADNDSDSVPDACDICPGFDDSSDTDADGVPDGCDACPGFDDSADSDADGVADGCDVCPGHDDAVDSDADGVADGCDACPGFDDSADADNDGAPDGCDTCAGHDDAVDADADGVADGCDTCLGFDDNADADNDGTPDGCDACAGGTGSGDANGDGLVDLDDYPSVSACLTGPGSSLGAGCECFDFDSDGDNDLADFAEFQMEFSGQ